MNLALGGGGAAGRRAESESGGNVEMLGVLVRDRWLIKKLLWNLGWLVSGDCAFSSFKEAWHGVLCKATLSCTHKVCVQDERSKVRGCVRAPGAKYLACQHFPLAWIIFLKLFSGACHDRILINIPYFFTLWIDSYFKNRLN